MSKQDYGTPQYIIDGLGPFDLDVAADRFNAKAVRYFDEEINGLAQPWIGERIWCNPPYNKPLPWVMKAEDELEKDAFGTCFMLLPASTSTAWFTKAYMICNSLFFFPQRLKFEGGASVARQDHVLFQLCSSPKAFPDVHIGESFESYLNYLDTENQVIRYML